MKQNKTVKVKYLAQCQNKECKQAIFPWVPEFKLSPSYIVSDKKSRCKVCGRYMLITGKVYS